MILQFENEYVASFEVFKTLYPYGVADNWKVIYVTIIVKHVLVFLSR